MKNTPCNGIAMPKKQQIILKVVTQKAYSLNDKITLPKGTIYGCDTAGEFFCIRYREIATLPNLVKPTLKVWRYREALGQWAERPESGPTTTKIAVFYTQHRGQCRGDIVAEFVAVNYRIPLKAKYDNTIRLHQAPYSHDFHGIYISEGAVYGKDKHGLFCITHVPNFEKLRINKAGYPSLYIWRPCKDTSKYRQNWQGQWEQNHTTARVLAYMCTHVHTQVDVRYDGLDNGAPVLRGNKDVTPYMTRGFRSSHTAKTRLTYVTAVKTLDDVAAEQRGKYLKGLCDD